MFPEQNYRHYGHRGESHPTPQQMFPTPMQPSYVPQPLLPHPSFTLQPVPLISVPTIGAYGSIDNDSIVVPVVVPRSFSIPPPPPTSFPTHAQYLTLTQEVESQTYSEGQSLPSSKPHTLTAEAPEFIPASYKYKTSNSDPPSSQLVTSLETSTRASSTAEDNFKGQTFSRYNKGSKQHESRHYQGEHYHKNSQERPYQGESHHLPMQAKHYQDEQNHSTSQAYNANQRHFERKTVRPKRDAKSISSSRPPWSDVPNDTPKGNEGSALHATQTQQHLQSMPSIHSMEDSHPAQNYRKGMHQQNFSSEEKQNYRQRHQHFQPEFPRGYNNDYAVNPYYDNFQQGHDRENYNLYKKNFTPKQFDGYQTSHPNNSRGRGNRFLNTYRPRMEYLNSSFRGGLPRHPSVHYPNEYTDHRAKSFFHRPESEAYFCPPSENWKYQENIQKFDEELYQGNYQIPKKNFRGGHSNIYRQNNRDYQIKGKLDEEFFKTRNPDIIRNVTGTENFDGTSSNSDVEIEEECTSLAESLEYHSERRVSVTQSGVTNRDLPQSDISDIDLEPVRTSERLEDADKHLENNREKASLDYHPADMIPTSETVNSLSPECTASDTTKAPAQIDISLQEINLTSDDVNKENDSHLNSLSSSSANNFNRSEEERRRDVGPKNLQRSTADMTRSDISQLPDVHFTGQKFQGRASNFERNKRQEHSRGSYSSDNYKVRSPDDIKDSGSRTNIYNATGAEKSNRGRRHDQAGRGGKAGVWRSDNRSHFNDNMRGSRVITPSNEVRENLEETLAKNKMTTRQSKVMLDEYNCDLNTILDQSGLGAFNLNTPLGFGKLWADCKATYGVNKGKSYFEVKIIELIDTSSIEENDQRPSALRVGWSEESATFEANTGSWSFGYKDSKSSIKGEGFCESTNKEDVLGAMVNFDSDPVEISFIKNGEVVGQPSFITLLTKNCALFPHISLKNCKVRVNFGQRETAWFPPPEGYSFISQPPINELVPSLVPPLKKSDCELVMVVGLPGCGKTAWALRQQEEHRDRRYNILSADLLMDLMSASKNGLEYADIFQEFFPLAEGCYKRLLMIASMKPRKFEVTSEESDESSKTKAPESVINEMKANFSVPEQVEGFTTIEYIGMKENDARELIGSYTINNSRKSPSLSFE
ncbi:heterogeneous nuclear ribonucleoprotein U isoform X2 [Biomphalaria glabrata]|nr:heterogeneous nuclear ribonucleoprotein U isoform X2 [Biomphalaria glabrata]